MLPILGCPTANCALQWTFTKSRFLARMVGFCDIQTYIHWKENTLGYNAMYFFMSKTQYLGSSALFNLDKKEHTRF